MHPCSVTWISNTLTDCYFCITLCGIVISAWQSISIWFCYVLLMFPLPSLLPLSFQILFLSLFKMFFFCNWSNPTSISHQWVWCSPDRALATTKLIFNPATLSMRSWYVKNLLVMQSSWKDFCLLNSSFFICNFVFFFSQVSRRRKDSICTHPLWNWLAACQCQDQRKYHHPLTHLLPNRLYLQALILGEGLLCQYPPYLKPTTNPSQAMLIKQAGRGEGLVGWTSKAWSPPSADNLKDSRRLLGEVEAKQKG